MIDGDEETKTPDGKKAYTIFLDPWDQQWTIEDLSQAVRYFDIEQLNDQGDRVAEVMLQRVPVESAATASQLVSGTWWLLRAMIVLAVIASMIAIFT